MGKEGVLKFIEESAPFTAEDFERLTAKRGYGMQKTEVHGRGDGFGCIGDGAEDGEAVEAMEGDEEGI